MILENGVCDHLRRIQYNLSGYRDTNVFYCENTGEIDFVLDGPDYLVPVEVKAGDTESSDLRAMNQFLEQNPGSIGFAINNADNLAQDERLVHIPAWLFFYLC